MSERRDYVALDWVAGEIEETLKQAAQALEAYIANRDDVTKLRFCLTHIHQVHGTLQMVEFHGAALVAREMEQLADAVSKGEIHDSHIDDALAVLKSGIEQLPVYLERVKESKHGLPSTLLPVLNDLRAVRGESLLSETVLFSPDMSAAAARGVAGELSLSGSELVEVAHKLRQMFQISLLGVIRGRDVRKNLNYLAKVCARLARISAGRPSQALWRACIAILEGLLNGSIDASVSIKILLRQVDQQIKRIINSGESVFEEAAPEELLKNLLYYVARSKASSKFIKEIKDEYKLGQALLGEGELDDKDLATPDGEAMRGVVEALVKEISDIEQAINAAGTDGGGLSNLLPQFRRVTDTMAILGMGEILKRVEQQHSELARLLAASDSPEQSAVQAVAAEIAAISQGLNPSEFIDEEQEQPLFNDSEEAQEKLDQAHESVVRESRVGLEQAKDAIIEFVATQWNHECLSEVPAQLVEIRGSLGMMQLHRAAEVVLSCENYITRELLENRSVPEWQMLDTLADAITSVDYYLERMGDGADVESEGEGVIDVAADSVAELGYPIAGMAATTPAQGSEEEYSAVEGNAGEMLIEDPAFEALAVDEEAAPTEELELPTLEDVSGESEEEDIVLPVLDELSEVAETIEADEDSSLDVDNIPMLDSEEPEVVETVAASEEAAVEDDEDFDPEIVEIFVEEAGEVLETIDEFLPQWRANEGDDEVRATVRRAFHTLKGSGRMVGALDIAELAWSVENMLNRVLEGAVKMDAQRFELIIETRGMMPVLVSAFEKREAVDKVALEAQMAKANLLAEQQDPGLPQSDAAVPVLEEVTAEESSEEIAGVEDDDTDTELLEIFAAEGATHLQALNDFINYCKQLAGPASFSDELQRALHTLKGSANMAGVVPIGMVITPLEYLVKELRASQLKVDQEVIVILEQGSAFIKAGLEQLTDTPLQILPGVDDYINELTALHKERMALAADREAEDNGIPPEALNEFLAGSLTLISDVADQLALWHKAELEPSQLPSLLQNVVGFVEEARKVNMDAPIELGELMVTFYDRAIGTSNEQRSASFYELAEAGNDALIDMLDQIAGHQTPAFEQSLFDQIETFEFEAAAAAVEEQDDTPVTEMDIPVLEIVEPVSSLPEDIEAELEDISFELEETPEPAEEEPVELEVIEETLAEQPVEIETEAPAYEPSDDEVDDEILEIFFEEAGDNLEEIDEAVHKWGEDRGNSKYVDDLQRVLHTLKGGARMAGLTVLGNLSHNFETFLMGAEGKEIDDDFFAKVLEFQDSLVSELESIKAGKAASSEVPEALSEQAIVAAAEESGQSTEPASEVESVRSASDVPATNVSAFKPPVVSGDDAAAPMLVDPTAKKGPQEVIKVSASLLEDLVNLAGETSISRGRAEEQISELVFSLEDMQITVDRLQEQVRRLDMETEQQILYRQEQVESEGLEGFDPLEMDRYSQLQQLSRSLLESSSDLIDIKSTLADKSRDMETLLIQQSRINSELQEGLMRSRMVPFSRMVPRLRRIVRQVSGELDKKVDFQLENVEGELDRSVLERMVAPLEHMLRNAVDHGIEATEKRVAAGKSKKGLINLSLTREGGEIVLNLSDDGGGINIDAVRKKALERGLMEPDAELSDREALQFILQAGFSTAESITQISGRGVGLDVVNSEIKQLGGSVEIESEFGQGTRFIVRLPFTVSVNRALMVSVGGDIYAIPLNTIEGIVRVSPFELEAYYQPEAPLFEYAGQPYLLRYMGALLQRGDKPNLEGHTMPLPVVLVRGVDHSVAVQVDSLLGSREIVVKPLGPQFGMVHGLTGATVLGDGSVVVILDLLAMLRADALLIHRDHTLNYEAVVEEEEKSLLVMVVDDSVTVRKVTSRFLERQGMEVVLAKDGVDAITQLNEIERVPDVMLLDIEMPRMDGFEVATRIRHTSRLEKLPIIMITSRTGDKHRERALSLGVDRYMGKPFQESELLETIIELGGITAE